MRAKKSARNMVMSSISQIITILVSIVSRKIFLDSLGASLLGLNSLFTQIVSILSIIELGIGPAIVFNLYEPLATGDHAKTNAYMDFYKKAYHLIGILVFGIGLLITPFVPNFAKDANTISQNIYVVFILFVASTALSYFWSYRRSLIIANQEQYLVNVIHSGFDLVMNAVQITVLLTTKNYYLYLIIKIASTVLENVVISALAQKKFSFLKTAPTRELTDQEKDGITKNTSALFLHKIGALASVTIDSIVLSVKSGLIAVATLNNYTLIVNAVRGVVTQLFSGLTASVGNLGATESNEKNIQVFNQTYLLNFYISSFCSVALFTLINPFVTLWLGPQHQLSTLTVGILVLNFYINTMRESVQTFKGAYGLYWHDRYKAIAEAGINLVMSLVLVNVYGLNGLLFATTISLVLTCMWVEPLVLYKNAFKMSLSQYFLKYGIYLGITVLQQVCTSLLINSVFKLGNTLIDFIIKMAIVVIVPLSIALLATFKTKEFKQLLALFKNLLKGRKTNQNKVM